MKTKKTIFNLKLSLLIATFSLFTLTACGCGSAPKGPKSKDNNKAIDLPNPKKNVIVLLHGLNCPRDSGIKELGDKLNSDIKNTEIIILDRENSGDVSTEQQAEEAYAALKKELEAKKLIGSAICLFGDSHGGLVALELYRKYKDQLNIRCIVTNHSPLEGAPGINASTESIKDFKDTLIKDIMAIIPANTKITINSMLQIAKPGATLENFLNGLDLKSIITDDIKESVRQDLTSNSILLKNVKTTLLNTQIPVLLLGAEVDIKTAILALFSFALGADQFGQFIVPQLKNILNTLSSKELVELETNFAAVIGDKRNDAFIPTYSQISENTLASTPQNVRRICSKSYHHFYRITRHTPIYSKLVDFINQAILS